MSLSSEFSLFYINISMRVHVNLGANSIFRGWSDMFYILSEHDMKSLGNIRYNYRRRLTFSNLNMKLYNGNKMYFLLNSIWEYKYL